MVVGRDFFVDEVLEEFKGVRVEPVSMPAEAPLFLMYTSGTTGQRKGCQHSTGGYLAYAAGTFKYVQDIHPEDVYWCMADIGWITGHSYIVYGPLALAAISIMYEGVPTHPDAGRPWRIAEQLDVNIFHTASTTVRERCYGSFARSIALPTSPTRRRATTPARSPSRSFPPGSRSYPLRSRREPSALPPWPRGAPTRTNACNSGHTVKRDFYMDNIGDFPYNRDPHLRLR